MAVVTEIKTGDFIIVKGDTCKVTGVERGTDGQLRFGMFNFDRGTEGIEETDADIQYERYTAESSEFILKEKKNDSLVFVSGTDEGEELEVPFSIIGENVKLLRNEEKVAVKYINGLIADIELPKVVVQVVESTEDIEKDNTRTDYIKDARLQNGKIVVVPAFIKNGDRIRINLDTGEYICRD
ncbi:MAG: hypothetical protein RBS89_03375 [Candidatus Delongbacteria bacterium]|jgi:elongation factor P|nr:hypothetical protein [Candidatus Delongbacteria bacterium]